MNTMSVTAAAVTGSRHLRAARNGQDAAASWNGGAAAAIVVCDGCGSGASSEVGARLGARLVLGALATRLAAGEMVATVWDGVRRDVGDEIARIANAMPGGRERVIHDHFLFTIVAAAYRRGTLAVWAIGDGAYAVDGRVRVLGPFADNQPPYLAYDLLGSPSLAHLEVIEASAGTAVVTTDGIAELGLDVIDPAHALSHPDALRRTLALLARGNEHVDWHARRIERVPARLQDDGAVAVMRWWP